MAVWPWERPFTFLNLKLSFCDVRVWDDITSKSPSDSENVMAFEEMLARNIHNCEQCLPLGGKLTAVLIFF